jgi:hypothetical protein
MSAEHSSSSPGAIRMRRSRERRRNGVRIIPIEVKDSGIEILASKGYLRPEERDNPEAIRRALGKILYWLFSEASW